jgi:dipeptidyl aminopeptidase/acylaminoacyl peptidase
MRNAARPFAAIVLLAAVSGVAAQDAPAKPHYYNPAWSPDGKQLVFESNREGKDAVYRINADGTGLLRLTSLEEGSYQPSWSPMANASCSDPIGPAADSSIWRTWTDRTSFG